MGLCFQAADLIAGSPMHPRAALRAPHLPRTPALRQSRCRGTSPYPSSHNLDSERSCAWRRRFVRARHVWQCTLPKPRQDPLDGTRWHALCAFAWPPRCGPTNAPHNRQAAVHGRPRARCSQALGADEPPFPRSNFRPRRCRAAPRLERRRPALRLPWPSATEAGA